MALFGAPTATPDDASNALNAAVAMQRRLLGINQELRDEGFPEIGVGMGLHTGEAIIGYIRQQTLGEALVPYEQRIEYAMQKIMASHRWSAPQRQWLERIGKQLRAETLVDREALDSGQFREQGGFKRLDKIFDGRLEQILGDITEALWEPASQSGGRSG